MNKKSIVGRLLIILMIMLYWTPCSAVLAMEFQNGVIVKDIVEWKDVTIPRDTVVDNVVVIGGNVTIAGTVKNEVVVINGNLTLQKTAQLSERAFVIDGKIIQEEGALVRKSFVNIRPDSANLTSLFFAGIMTLLLEFIKLTIGIFIVMIPPLLAWGGKKKNSEFQMICEKYFFKNIFIGILASIAFFIIETLLTISVVGIPLGIIFAVVFLVIAIVGISALCMTMGIWIANKISLVDKSIFIQTLCGSTLIALLVMIPFAGIIVLSLAILFGIGVVIMSLCKRGGFL